MITPGDWAITELGKAEPRPCTAHSVRHAGHSSHFRPFFAGSGLPTAPRRPVTQAAHVAGGRRALRHDRSFVITIRARSQAE